MTGILLMFGLFCIANTTAAYTFGWWWRGRFDRASALRLRDEYRAQNPRIVAAWGGTHGVVLQPIAEYLTRGHHAALGMVSTRAKG